MKINPRNTIALLAALTLFARLAPAADHESKVVSADEALARLKAGNDRFVTPAAATDKHFAERRAETAQTQHPFAIIVGCADSRTSPELVYDQNLGDLFVVRTAGNLVEDYALGSIEYAVEHLGARLVVVLGHERCGAVKAALGSASAPGHVNALVRDIQPAVLAAKTTPGDVLMNTVVRNAKLVADKIRKQAAFGELASQVKVVSAYYDLDTGKIEWAPE